MTWSFAVTMQNDTNRHMEAYPVVVTPPPPHREHDPSQDVAAQSQASIDPNGFNITYYVPTIQNPSKPNGLFIAFALEDSPPVIQYRLLRYQVAPGQEGQDPGLQPAILSEDVVEVTWQADTLILLDRDNLVTISQAP